MQQGAGNSIIEDVPRRPMARINFLRPQSMSHAGRAEFSVQEMRAILQAIARGDSRPARRAADEPREERVGRGQGNLR
jgi:DNA-binding GntR family transcriptional regulator